MTAPRKKKKEPVIKSSVASISQPRKPDSFGATRIKKKRRNKPSPTAEFVMALKHNHEKPIERDRERRYQHAGKEQNIRLMGFSGEENIVFISANQMVIHRR